MLVLPGTLTHREAPDAVRMLGQVVQREADQGGPQAAVPVAIDASALTHFDSSALAVLLECRRLAAAAGRRIELRHAPRKLEQLARLYGLDDILGMA
jgi:phospholipid transport system transporter-binding protein